MDGGARFEWTLRVAGAGAAEMAWEEATGERGLSGRLEWGWSCRNGMGGEWTLRVAGAGAAEMAGFFWLGAAWVKSRAAERPSVSEVN